MFNTIRLCRFQFVLSCPYMYRYVYTPDLRRLVCSSTIRPWIIRTQFQGTRFRLRWRQRQTETARQPLWNGDVVVFSYGFGYAHVPYVVSYTDMISMPSDANAIKHSDSYLLDLSLALQSCDPDISYYEVEPPIAVDPDDANHEHTSEFCTHNS